jgi:hypothetical protein
MKCTNKPRRNHDLLSIKNEDLVFASRRFVAFVALYLSLQSH